MIVDVLKNSNFYTNVHPRFAKAFAFLEKAHAELPAEGRYEIDGDDIFAMVQKFNTVPTNETCWEAHKKYIDIQFIHSGTEIISWDNIVNVPEDATFDEVNDRYLYPGAAKSPIVLHSGTFGIFFPQDLHRPGELYKHSESVTKIVVKVRL